MARVNDMMGILKGNLKLVLPALTYTEGVVSGDPVLTINDGTAATGENNAYIKIKQKAYSGYPQSSLANSTNKDGQPHLVQVVFEESAVATKPLCTALFIAQVMKEVAGLNAEMELFLSDTTVVPVEAQITDANLMGVIRADARHPNQGV